MLTWLHRDFQNPVTRIAALLETPLGGCWHLKILAREGLAFRKRGRK